MTINTYINFQGKAKEAIEFYKEVLKTEEPFYMYYKEMPEDPNFPVPDGCGDWLMHGSINYHGQKIMFSDVLPHADFKQGNNISLLIDLDDPDELKKLFDAFNINAKITMPFGETYWAQAFGSLIDQFGIEWQFNSSRPD